MEGQDSRLELSPATMHDHLMASHRIADARWRSNLASCYTLLKEVLLNSDSWDPNNTDSGRISKVKILQKSADYIRTLESIIISELKGKVFCIDDTENPTSLSFEKICSDFLKLESSKYVDKKNVGPYVEEYLQLLAMDEAAKLVQNGAAPSSIEEAKENVSIFNPYEGTTMWRIPSQKEPRKENVKRRRRPKVPTVIQLTKSACLQTPISAHRRKSSFPQRLPSLKGKDQTITGEGRPNVKRRLLDEMDELGMEEPEYEVPHQLSSLSGSSQLFDTDFGAVADQNVPEIPQPSPMTIPMENQEVPYCYFENNLACEVEVATSEIISFAPTDNKPVKYNRKTSSATSSETSSSKRWTNSSSKRTVLGEISYSSLSQESNVQQVPEYNIGSFQDLNSMDYTVLRTVSSTPNVKTTFVKFSPIHGLSPDSSDKFLTPEDPLLNSTIPEPNSSPGNMPIFGTPNQDTCSDINTSPGENSYASYCSWLVDNCGNYKLDEI